jgi:hypothetical protein
MGLNELIFGGLAVLGIMVFVFVGRFRANRSQRERTDRLQWDVDPDNFTDEKSEPSKKKP